MSTCDAVRDALIDGSSLDAYATHIAGCPACQGLTTMTRSIDDELKQTPVTAGQRPQWIAELYARRAHRRRQTLLVTGWLAAVCFLGVVAYGVTRLERTTPHAAAPGTPTGEPRHVTTVPPPPAPTIERPRWVTSLVPFTGSCTVGETISCLGVSSYVGSRDVGRAEARDVALEALSLHVADQLHSQLFMKVRAMYEPAMHAQLAAYTRAADDEATVATSAAYRKLADSRRRAAQALEQRVGATLPPQPADWYWEEYAAAEPKDTDLPWAAPPRYLVVVRYSFEPGAVARMVAEYDRDDAAVAFPLRAFSPN